MKKEPKDINRSIRDKYNRRLMRLYLCLEEFEIAAEDRLSKKAGKIRNRAVTENYLEQAKLLKKLLPDPFADEK